MRKVIVLSMITLDGVMQGPGGPEEDTSAGFRYGGWVAPFSDDVYNSVVQQELQPAEYILGRKTYEIWAGYWPQHSKSWPGIDDGMKYVLSAGLSDTDPIITGWSNSSVIRDVSDITRIKNMTGPDLQVWGSSELVHLLLKHDLVDELRLKIHPVILGAGKKLFNDDSFPSAFTLTEQLVTSTGVIIANYKRSGDVLTGTAGEEKNG